MLFDHFPPATTSTQLSLGQGRTVLGSARCWGLPASSLGNDEECLDHNSSTHRGRLPGPVRHCAVRNAANHGAPDSVQCCPTRTIGWIGEGLIGVQTVTKRHSSGHRHKQERGQETIRHTYRRVLSAHQWQCPRVDISLFTSTFLKVAFSF